MTGATMQEAAVLAKLDKVVEEVREVIRKRVIARGGEPKPVVWENENYSFNFAKREAKVKGKVVDMTPKEWAVLETLIAADGKVVTRETFLQKIWGHDSDITIDTRTVDQHIARLRTKLKDRVIGARNGRLVQVVTNFGYKWGGNN
jgi:two-component system, OmpR family, alkaline phosphatase synthesis response regulator PhoP